LTRQRQREWRKIELIGGRFVFVMVIEVGIECRKERLEWLLDCGGGYGNGELRFGKVMVL
jgi:hypothetical protein